jgi:DNA replication protein DnaC
MEVVMSRTVVDLDEEALSLASEASIAIGTNLPFSEWGTVFPDPRLVAAVVDRVTFNATILETGTQSYRLRTTKTRKTI